MTDRGMRKAVKGQEKTRKTSRRIRRRSKERKFKKAINLLSSKIMMISSR
jgi:hypothetical protein